MLQRLRVGVLAGLHEVVQVEVARDERGGLAVRLVQGQRLIPLHLLEARALAEAVGPKRLHLFKGYCAATSPAVRRPCARRARSAAEGPAGARPPSAGSHRPGAAAPPGLAGAPLARR